MVLPTPRLGCHASQTLSPAPRAVGLGKRLHASQRGVGRIFQPFPALRSRWRRFQGHLASFRNSPWEGCRANTREGANSHCLEQPFFLAEKRGIFSSGHGADSEAAGCRRRLGNRLRGFASRSENEKRTRRSVGVGKKRRLPPKPIRKHGGVSSSPHPRPRASRPASKESSSAMGSCRRSPNTQRTGPLRIQPAIAEKDLRCAKQSMSPPKQASPLPPRTTIGGDGVSERSTTPNSKAAALRAPDPSRSPHRSKKRTADFHRLRARPQGMPPTRKPRQSQAGACFSLFPMREVRSTTKRPRWRKFPSSPPLTRGQDLRKQPRAEMAKSSTNRGTPVPPPRKAPAVAHG